MLNGHQPHVCHRPPGTPDAPATQSPDTASTDSLWAGWTNPSALVVHVSGRVEIEVHVNVRRLCLPCTTVSRVQDGAVGKRLAADGVLPTVDAQISAGKPVKKIVRAGFSGIVVVDLVQFNERKIGTNCLHHLVAERDQREVNRIVAPISARREDRAVSGAAIEVNQLAALDTRAKVDSSLRGKRAVENVCGRDDEVVSRETQRDTGAENVRPSQPVDPIERTVRRAMNGAVAACICAMNARLAGSSGGTVSP